jgi:chorismate dehydratase
VTAGLRCANDQTRSPRPLVYGLDRQGDRFAVRFDVPSRCATLLHAGEVDLGLIPSIEYLRGDYRIVPATAIASEGPVASVAVFSSRALPDVRSIALDTSSRTSVALLRVLCAERFGIAPAFASHGPDLEAMLRRNDAALLIGDPALWADHVALGLVKIDLGQEWTDHTGLPFVWAFWAGREDAIDGEGVDALIEARDGGVVAIEEIAAAYAGADRARFARTRDYLRTNVHFDLGDRHEEALRRFYASAARLGIVPRAAPPRFFERSLSGAEAGRRHVKVGQR